MPIRAACPSCAAVLTAPDSSAGKAVTCPSCRTAMLLPVPPAAPPAPTLATVVRPVRPPADAAARPPRRDDRGDDRPRPRRPDEDEEEDRPRKKPRKRKAEGGHRKLLIALACVGAAVVVLSITAVIVVWLTVGGSDQGGGLGVLPSLTGKRYVPRESEKEFEKLMQRKKLEEITEQDVYDAMGTPTRKDLPKVITKNGQTFTVYTAYWEGDGVQSQVSFMNGRVAGMIIGLQVTFPPKGGR